VAIEVNIYLQRRNKCGVRPVASTIALNAKHKGVNVHKNTHESER